MMRWPGIRRRAHGAGVALGEWVRVTAFLLILLLAVALLAPAALVRIANLLPETLRSAAEAGGTAVAAALKLPLSGIGFLAVLVLALIAVLWTALRRPLAMGQTGFRLLLDRLIQLIALGLLLPLLLYFFRACMGPAPKATDIVTLAAMVLVVALFLAGGPLLLSRLKKVGPLELFETAAPALAKRLAELLELEKRGISPTFDEDLGPPTPVAVEEARRADTLILLFDALGQPETLSGDARRNLGALLFYVGACAVRRKHWATARDRLERLQRLTGASSDRNEITFNLPFKLAYNLGRAYLGPVIDPREAREQGLTYDPRDKRERNKLLRMSLDCFRRAAAEDPLSRDAWFNYAWVADELGLIGPTVESLETVLKLNPDDAPAKLNLAISLLKKRDLRSAFERLETITAADRDGEATLNEMMTDPDLEPLRTDPSYARRLLRFLEKALPGGAGSAGGESRA